MIKCERLEELVEAQIPALIEAVYHRKNLLEEEKHMKIPYHMAEKDFMNRYINSWAEGFKMAYCLTGCPDREVCKIGWNNLHKYQEYYKKRGE